MFSKIESKPDLVVAILNGGGFVLEEFKSNQNLKGVTCKTVKVQRLSTTKGVKQKAIVKRFLKVLPYSILNIIRVLEHKTNNKITNRDSLGEIDFDFTENEDAQHILVLDDALDSGTTMQIVTQSLEAYFPKASIKSAVVAWTNSESAFSPDYYNLKNTLVRFPWSLDYKTNKYE